MKLVLSPLASSKAIKLVVRSEGKEYEEIALTGEELLPTLDKILKSANMDINSIRAIRVTPEPQASLTSIRLAQTLKHALLLANSFPKPTTS